MGETDHFRPNQEESKNEEENDGSLTIAVDSKGVDTYDFGPRAIVVREIKEELKLKEFEPLPSPRTLEFEPTLICNARCHFCSYEEDIAAFEKERRLSVLPRKPYGLSRETVFDVLDALRVGGTTAGTFWSGGGRSTSLATHR